MTGYLHGGWGYVWAAYGWTAFVLLAYGLSLVARYHPLPPGEGPRSGGEGR